ncbi:helix-turn-helix transcriptional regulator [Paenibacillus donghaensis]|uniref:helix-turn-helix transcriptional regulator n=1 Tax=Paenibacillus donghaensis TaxID=414771 RepID=UPI0018835536|nr:helix-turn-helix transcriptional regulator [Paenibacillus donghaensis]MBE9916630.1 helix-turn-helix transcriptional regulator [Paenibacillus donghaensis]
MYAPIQFIDHRLLHPQLTYREMPPCASLRPFVACYWYLKSSSPLQEEVPHRVLPDGCVDILFDFTAGKVNFVGVMSKADLVPLIGDVHLMGIRFLPQSIPFLLKGEAGFLANGMLGLGEVWGRQAAFAGKVLVPELSAAQRIEIMEKELISRFKHYDPDPKWSGMLNFITEKNGKITIAELADYYPISERHIARTFKSLVGITAKEYASIIRFQSVLQQLKQMKSSINWSDLSVHSGFYDQSHFINEFKKRYGITPGSLIADACPIFPIQSPSSLV